VTHRDPDYLALVRHQHCCFGHLCDGGTEAHHAFGSASGGGRGLKGSDYLAVPLCRRHHHRAHSQPVTLAERAAMLAWAIRHLAAWLEGQCDGDRMRERLVRAILGNLANQIATDADEACRSWHSEPEPCPVPESDDN
jgi:hypothetical protein